MRWATADAPLAADDQLTDDERARLLALRRPADRARFRSAHLLGRLAVAEALGVELESVVIAQRCARCGGPHGIPVAVAADRPAPYLSLAHAGTVVAAAVARVPVGLDLEQPAGVRAGVAAAALTRGERAQLDALSPQDRPAALTRWWVRKEAILKATGHGLRIDPRRLAVGPPHEAPRLVAWDGPDRPRALRLADVDLPGQVASVAALTLEPIEVLAARIDLNPATG